MSSGTTAVIAPLVSLQEHMVERFSRDFVYEKAQSAHGDMRAQIIIVSLKSAVSGQQGAYHNLNDLHGRRGLVRIVFDECHTVMAARPILPPRCRSKIRPDDMQMFRGPTARPKIAYSVQEYTESDNTDVI